MSRALLSLLAISTLARADEARHLLEDDPVVQAITSAALQARPELAQAQEAIAAASFRAEQASVFPDPFLGVSVQNDSFTRWQVGSMSTSFVAISASQTFPWFGKRALRGEVMESGVALEKTALTRTERSLRAEIQRSYLALLLVRERLQILSRLEALWLKSGEVARARYESGEGAQSDLLRAQLERARLTQRKLALQASEFQTRATLNRLRGHPAGDALESPTTLSSLEEPGELPGQEHAPELQRYSLLADQLERQVALAHREAFPDVTLNASVMDRGRLEPMWQLGVGVNVPIWTFFKQQQAALEFEAQGRSTRHAQESLQQLLTQRTAERADALKTLREMNRLSRGGLLVQSEATVSATLAQYQVGRVAFSAVLESLVGYLGDYERYLQSVAALQRLLIAHREASLEPVVLDETPAPTPGAPAAAGM